MDKLKNIAIGVLLIVVAIYAYFFLKVNDKVPVSGAAALELREIIKEVAASAGGRAKLESCHRVGQKFVVVICSTEGLRRETLENKLTSDGWVFARKSSSPAYPEVSKFTRGHDNISLEGDTKGNIQILSLLRSYGAN